MSKVIIHYFTGTGNTAHSVKLISEQLQAAGHEVKIRPVKKGVLPPGEVFDYHIIAFPVLSWSAPVMMKHYLRKKPQGNGVKQPSFHRQERFSTKGNYYLTKSSHSSAICRLGNHEVISTSLLSESCKICRVAFISTYPSVVIICNE